MCCENVLSHALAYGSVLVELLLRSFRIPQHRDPVFGWANVLGSETRLSWIRDSFQFNTTGNSTYDYSPLLAHPNLVNAFHSIASSHGIMTLDILVCSYYSNAFHLHSLNRYRCRMLILNAVWVYHVDVYATYFWEKRLTPNYAIISEWSEPIIIQFMQLHDLNYLHSITCMFDIHRHWDASG